MSIIIGSLLIAIGLGIMVILQGLRRIPASPPHKAQVTLFGKRIPVFKDEGWRFFPLFPYFFGFILVKVERIAFTIVAERARTPDRANTRVPIVVTIRPSSNHLIQYLDSGGEEGVKQQFTGKIQERMREWGMGGEEGPANWRELNRSQLEATSVLVKKIAGKSLVKIPDYAQKVPTFIWLRYFSQPRPTKNFLENEEPWAKDEWKRVEDTIRTIKENNGDHAFDALKKAVEERREQVDAIRMGTAKILIEDLGVFIERLNLGDMDVLGGVSEQAEAQAREVEEREAEKVELSHVKQRILLFTEMGYSKEKALEIVQTERGKVAKTISENQFSIPPETREMVEKIASPLAGSVAKLFAKKGDKNI